MRFVFFSFLSNFANIGKNWKEFFLEWSPVA